MLSLTPVSAPSPRAEAASRLRQLRGQLDDIISGLEAPTPCPPVLKRIYSIQDQLQAVQRTLVQHHLKDCLQRAALAPDEAAAQQVLAEIQKLYGVRREGSYLQGRPAAAQ